MCVCSLPEGLRDQLHYGRVFIFACCQHKQYTVYIIYTLLTQSRFGHIIVTTRRTLLLFMCVCVCISAPIYITLVCMYDTGVFFF